MIHGYPYTDFHELNLDYILKLCRESMGLHFDQADKYLKLVNQAGEEVSKIKIFYAETALKDDDGNIISTYLIDAGVDGNNLVFDRGNGEIVTLTVPYAVKAEKDTNNVDLTSYVHGVGVSGNKILITFGNGTTYNFTVPFATKAQNDENGKAITTYVAELSTANDKLIVTDGDGTTLAELTIPYAVKALNDVDGDAIKDTYGTELTTDTTTVQLRAKNGSIISTITVPYAVKAVTDTEGNTFLGDYAYNLAVNGNKVGLEAHNGTTLNEITVPFATLSENSTNAIASVSISGDEIVFTTYGGTSYRITSPYSVKALKDSLNNTISTTYVASVTNDPDTGEISFYASDGTLISTLVPTLDSAIHDSYGNLIADYVKEIIVNPQNNYVVVNHGTGDSDTLTINYATHAYKDTYENVIGNTYIRSLSIITDTSTNTKYLVAYNGELSELFRIAVDDFQTELTPIIVKFNEQTTDITSVVLKGSTEQLTASDVKQLFNEGHSIYATPSGSQGTVYYPVYMYVDTPTDTAFESKMYVGTVVSGNSTLTGVTNWQFNLDNGTYTNKYTPFSKPIVNASATDTPTGTINAGDTITRNVVIDITGNRTMTTPILAYCTPGSTWNDFVHVVNARIQATSGATEVIVRYLIYNPSATAQTLSGDVNIGLYV